MAQLTNEVGFTGLSEWSGQIQEDFIKELRGLDGYKRYNEMRLNSPVIGALLLAIEQSIRGITWQYVSDEGDEDPRIVFLEEAKDGMSNTWNDHIIEVLSFLPFGYAPFEIVYKRDYGRLLWRKFAFRGQDTVYKWLFDDAGGLAGIVQQGAPDYQLREIPIEKMVLYRTRVEKNNPEGRSLLRPAWIPYYYAKNIMQIEAIGAERDMAGLPVIKLPDAATTDMSDSSSDAYLAAKFVRNIRNDEQAGIVLPNGWELTLLSTGGTRQFDTNAIIQRYESRMLMSALAQFLMLGQDRVGTQALSSDQTDFWTMSVNAISDIIAETHTQFALKRLLRLNGMDDNGVRLEHSPAGDVDIGALADFFSKIGNKITWLPTDEVWLRGLARLPEATPEEIEEERTKRVQEQQQMFQRAAEHNPFEQKERKEEEEREDKMGVTWYSRDDGKAPDDEERLAAERRLERVINNYYNEFRPRALKLAKRKKNA